MRKDEKEKKMAEKNATNDENLDGAMNAIKDEMKAIFKRFKKNNTIVINLGKMEDPKEFMERFNIIIQVANSFKFDLVGMESDGKGDSGMMLGIFKNMQLGLGGIHIHLADEDDGEVDEEVQETEDGDMTELEDENLEDEENVFPFPVRKRKKLRHVPLYV